MTHDVSAASRRLCVACAVLVCALWGVSARADTPSGASAVTAFVNVAVVPMDTNRVLPHQTVLVRDGRIVALGGSVAVPAGATLIDGHDRAYLSPGLADMHVHADSAEDMKVFLAHGVTSVLNMGHESESFMNHRRAALNRGELPGPHVYTSLLVDGSGQFDNLFVTTPAEARAIVGIARTNGYDYIKVYNDLSPACFEAIIDEGKRIGMGVIGHGVTRVGLEKQLAMGQVMVAHTEEFLYTVFSHPDLRDPNPAIRDPSPPNAADIPAAIAFVKRDKAFVTADLNTYATMARQWGKPEVLEGIMRSPELRHLSPARRVQWGKGDYANKKGSADANLAFLKRFTKALSDADVPLITGTDAPSIPGLAPGSSLLQDLDALEAAGLSRFQVLSAATRTPGDFIRRTIPGSEPFGTVAVGQRADLVLTAANPLDDLSTLRTSLGVMANGRWYSPADLQALLDQVAKAYRDSAREGQS